MSLDQLDMTARLLTEVLQYEDQWTNIKKRLLYKLLPFIYWLGCIRPEDPYKLLPKLPLKLLPEHSLKPPWLSPELRCPHFFNYISLPLHKQRRNLSSKSSLKALKSRSSHAQQCDALEVTISQRRFTGSNEKLAGLVIEAFDLILMRFISLIIRRPCGLSVLPCYKIQFFFEFARPEKMSIYVKDAFDELSTPESCPGPYAKWEQSIVVPHYQAAL